jgi:hypothetical protein
MALTLSRPHTPALLELLPVSKIFTLALFFKPPAESIRHLTYLCRQIFRRVEHHAAYCPGLVKQSRLAIGIPYWNYIILPEALLELL